MHKAKQELLDILEKYDKKGIIEAINRIGVESLTGCSFIEEHELNEFLNMMDHMELFEVWVNCDASLLSL